jgi:hypothetical protein
MKTGEAKGFSPSYFAKDTSFSDFTLCPVARTFSCARRYFKLGANIRVL